MKSYLHLVRHNPSMPKSERTGDQILNFQNTFDRVCDEIRMEIQTDNLFWNLIPTKLTQSIHVVQLSLEISWEWNDQNEVDDIFWIFENWHMSVPWVLRNYHACTCNYTCKYDLKNEIREVFPLENK
jgi:putative NADPH-quinone reductase